MAKTQKVSPQAHSVQPSRRLQLPTRHWYNPLTWRRRVPLPPRRAVPSTMQMLSQVKRLFRRGRRAYVGIMLVYALGVLVFVRSFSVAGSVDSAALESAKGFGEKLGAGIDQLGVLLQTGLADVSAASGVYQIIISTVCCLAIIWTTRELLSEHTVTTKASFYQGMRPLIPYTLVLAMLGVYLIPMALGGYFYSLAVSIFTGLPVFLALCVFILLSVWSVSMFVHGIFALFIVTLPKTTPIPALRTAKRLVLRRRLLVLRKILAAICIALIVSAIILVPFVIWLPAVAPWMVYLLGVGTIIYGELFLYVLYRELL